jgi:hypothetical protein
VVIAFALFGAAFGATAYLAIEEIANAGAGIGMRCRDDSDSARERRARRRRYRQPNDAPIEVDPVSARVSDTAPVLDEPTLRPLSRSRAAKAGKRTHRIARSAPSARAQGAPNVQSDVAPTQLPQRTRAAHRECREHGRVAEHRSLGKR